MGKTIAMTGATGFAGRHVIAELLMRGHRINALVRNPARAAPPEGIEVITGDLEDAAALASLVRGADAIVHLAGVIAAIKPGDYFRYNTFPTRALAEAAVQTGIRRFVFASSLAAREEGLSFYGDSKFAAEEGLRHLFNGHLSTIILRAPAIYGPGDRATLPLIKQLTGRIALIPGRPEQRFSLLFVEDFARMVGDAVASDATGVVEVSDGTPGGYGWDDLIAIAQATEGRDIRPIFLPKPIVASVAAVAHAVARLTGKAGMVNPGKVRELYHRDWVARGTGMALLDPVTFARGFPETLAWYRAAGWLPPRREADRSSASLNREAGQ